MEDDLEDVQIEGQLDVKVHFEEIRTEVPQLIGETAPDFVREEAKDTCVNHQVLTMLIPGPCSHVIFIGPLHLNINVNVRGSHRTLVRVLNRGGIWVLPGFNYPDDASSLKFDHVFIYRFITSLHYIYKI
jgi:hypothetical protein